MKLKSNRALWGIILILFGVGFAGNALDFWRFSTFFNGWQTLFVIPCVVSIAIGILFLLFSCGSLSKGAVYKLFFPIVLVLIGLSVLYISSAYKKHFKENNSTNVIFGSQKITYNNEVFTGATLNSIFGGIDMDISTAYLQEDIVINCTSIFSGMNIHVPENVNVQVSGVPIFGGLNNHVKNNNPDAPTIFVNVTCIFGGINIK